MAEQQIGCTHPSLGCSSLRDDGSPARWGCVICGIEFVPKPQATEEIQRLSALVRAQQITIDKLEAQREWVGLTASEVEDIAIDHVTEISECCEAIREAEAKLKEKNGGAM